MYTWILAAVPAVLVLAFAGALLCRRLAFQSAVRQLEGFQSDLLARQVNEVENLYRQIRGMRHDLRNHAQTMQAFLELNQIQKLSDYLAQLAESFEQVDTVVRTGNVMADAILNSKLSLARSQGANVNVKAIVPPVSCIPDVSLCTILGNLLDNAMEACQRLEKPEERFIRIYIAPMKGELYISVTNSAPGKARQENGAYLSAKPGRGRLARHGFGLQQIDRMAKSSGGFVNRQQEEGVFATEVMLPLE